MEQRLSMWRRAHAAWQRARQRWWVRWGVELGVLALVAATVMAWQTRHLPPSGTPAPELVLRDLEGREVRLADLRGRPAVLAFWAPWCGPCKLNSANLSALRRRVGDDVHVLSVAVAWEDVEEVHRFVREQEVDYRVLLGGPAQLAAWRVDTFPTLFFLSPEGRVEHTVVGYTTQLGMHGRLWL